MLIFLRVCKGRLFLNVSGDALVEFLQVLRRYEIGGEKHGVVPLGAAELGPQAAVLDVSGAL